MSYPRLAPQWASVLLFGPLALALCAHALDGLLKRTWPRWQRLSQDDSKRRNALLALLRALVDLICLGLSAPALVQLSNTWGAAPTWMQNETMFAGVLVAGGFTTVFYLFELAFRVSASWDTWLHHVACVVLLAVSMTGLFLQGDALQQALMVSWLVYAGFATCLNAPFAATMFAYHLALDNFEAKQRLVAFGAIYCLFCDRVIEFLPLAFTIVEWHLLSTTSKAIQLALVSCFLPEHIVCTRIMWAIYCLNRGRVQAARLLPTVDAAVSLQAGASGANHNDAAAAGNTGAKATAV